MLDELQGILQDNSYVPTAMQRPSSARSKNANSNSTKNLLKKQQSKPHFPPPPPQQQSKRANLMALHKQSRKQPMTFQQVMKQQQSNFGIRNDSGTGIRNDSGTGIKNDSFGGFSVDANFNKTLQKKKSLGGFDILQAQENFLRPNSRSREKEQQKMQTLSVQRRMKPPINRKNIDQSIKFESQSNEGNKNVDMTRKNFNPNFEDRNEYKPNKTTNFNLAPGNNSGSNNSEELKQIRKVMNDQLQFQKKSHERLAQQEKQFHKNQIDNLKKMHQEQLKKKLQLKDFEISKLKQYYEMQLKVKSERFSQKQSIDSYNRKLQNNMNMMQKLQKQMQASQRHTESTYNQKKMLDLKKKQQELENQRRQIKERERKCDEKQKELKQWRDRFQNQKDRQLRRIQDYQSRVVKQQQQLQSKYRKKERDLAEQFDEKSVKLRKQTQQSRRKQMQLQDQKARQQQLKEDLDRQIKQFQQKRKLTFDDLHVEKTKVMQKQIQINSRLNQITAKQNEIEIIRHQLINKNKLLELQRKKVDLDRQTGFKQKFTLNKTSGTNDAVKYQSNLQKTIKDMKNQYLRTLPQF